MAVIVSVVLIVLGIVILVFIHACIVGRALRGEFENEMTTVGRSNDINREATSCMRRDDLDKLPCFQHMAKEEPTGSPVDCAVCLGKFQTGEKCRLLPVCNHSFHAQCVDQWLLVTPVCPICRTSALESIKGVHGDETS